MPIEQLRRVVANATVLGWLGLWQAVTIAQHIDKLEAVQRAAAALAQRISERKEYQKGQSFNVSQAELAK